MTLVVSITTALELALQHDSNFWQESDGTVVASETDPIGRWDDQSGNGNHAIQATTAFKPTLGSGKVSPDGSDDFLTIDAISSVMDGGGDYTVYFVGDVPDPILNGKCLWSCGESIANEVTGIRWRTTSSIRSIMFSDSDNVGTTSTLDTLGVVSVFSFVKRATEFELFQDGASLDTPTSLPSGTIDRDQFTIFAERDDVTRFFLESSAYAIYVYSAAHNDTDRGTIEGELTAEYISSDLSLLPDPINDTDTPLNATIANVAAQSLAPDVISDTDAPLNATIALEGAPPVLGVDSGELVITYPSSGELVITYPSSGELVITYPSSGVLLSEP